MRLLLFPSDFINSAGGQSHALSQVRQGLSVWAISTPPMGRKVDEEGDKAFSGSVPLVWSSSEQLPEPHTHWQTACPPCAGKHHQIDICWWACPRNNFSEVCYSDRDLWFFRRWLRKAQLGSGGLTRRQEVESQLTAWMEFFEDIAAQEMWGTNYKDATCCLPKCVWKWCCAWSVCQASALCKCLF